VCTALDGGHGRFGLVITEEEAIARAANASAAVSANTDTQIERAARGSDPCVDARPRWAGSR
jgi:hypothetical protein